MAKIEKKGFVSNRILNTCPSPVQTRAPARGLVYLSAHFHRRWKTR